VFIELLERIGLAKSVVRPRFQRRVGSS